MTLPQTPSFRLDGRRALVTGGTRGIGRVEDLLSPIVFLASDAAALITGTSLLVDGGWIAE